ncbi:hypothetical protein ACROYT_G013831 [Oculina patagonica]
MKVTGYLVVLKEMHPLGKHKVGILVQVFGGQISSFERSRQVKYICSIVDFVIRKAPQRLVPDGVEVKCPVTFMRYSNQSISTVSPTMSMYDYSQSANVASIASRADEFL